MILMSKHFFYVVVWTMCFLKYDRVAFLLLYESISQNLNATARVTCSVATESNIKGSRCCLFAVVNNIVTFKLRCVMPSWYCHSCWLILPSTCIYVFFPSMHLRCSNFWKLPGVSFLALSDLRMTMSVLKTCNMFVWHMILLMCSSSWKLLLADIPWIAYPITC